MGEVSTIGLDIAKSVFQIHGADADQGGDGLAVDTEKRSGDLKPYSVKPCVRNGKRNRTRRAVSNHKTEWPSMNRSVQLYYLNR
jgi:hypothetical protein